MLKKIMWEQLAQLIINTVKNLLLKPMTNHWKHNAAVWQRHSTNIDTQQIWHLPTKVSMPTVPSIVISFVYVTGDFSLCAMKGIKKAKKRTNNWIIIMHEAKEEETLPQKSSIKSLDVEDKLWLNMKHEPGTQWEAYKGEYWANIATKLQHYSN